jgi:hypothetical protein
MKQLYPKQLEALDFFTSKIDSGFNTLDASATGTGKTVVAAHLAKHWGKPVAVLCPKAVIPSWERELAEVGVDPLFILNYEKIRGGRTPHMTKVGKSIMNWKIPKNTLVLLDEVHKCKGPYTQNAQLYISLTLQGFTTHAMSATAAENPTEMRGLGFALGLHTLNKSKGSKRSFYGWMKQNGCFLDEWGKWGFCRARSGVNPKLTQMHDTLFRSQDARACRLNTSDFPDSFRENMVFYEPVQFTKAKQIEKAFKELDITPDILTDYIENGTVENSDNIVLVNILRARQLSESLKAPDIAEMAEDLLLEGKSVVVFVNFTQTVDALVERLKCLKIDGRQNSAERQEAIDRFQRDEDNVLVVNIAAGGTGVSLHDVRGERQRVSIISPTYVAKDHLQCLGRIHRNGAKSDAIQKVLYADKTIEESVIKSLKTKINNIDTLNNGR